jgi:NADH dehydrogenase (ubiquinone) Fe-S protein 3
MFGQKVKRMSTYKLLQINLLFILHLFKIIPSFITLTAMKSNQIIVYVKLHSVYKTVFIFKKYTNTRIDYLSDITVVDYPMNIARFELVYNFISTAYNSRLRIKSYVNELISLSSLSLLFSSSNWFEREIWDLFGIYFFEHYRLRRILTDYGFLGHPLRKDFPTSGFLEVRYNEEKQKITYEPIQLNCLGRFLHNK